MYKLAYLSPMDVARAKYDVIERLKREVCSLQGFRKSCGDTKKVKLGAIDNAFPDRTFPIGAIHELISHRAEDAAATNGFVSGVLGQLMKQGGTCLWVSTKRTVYPPALKLYGINPERIIFVDLVRHKDALWAIEEALKCEALTAVVGEINELSFTESRRLQLATEQSRVTGFIHRYNPRRENITACVTRWKIKPIASYTEDDLTGVGFQQWQVQLTKVRNGKPDTWQVAWLHDGFHQIHTPRFTISDTQRLKTG